MELALAANYRTLYDGKYLDHIVQCASGSLSENKISRARPMAKSLVHLSYACDARARIAFCQAANQANDKFCPLK